MVPLPHFVATKQVMMHSTLNYAQKVCSARACFRGGSLYYITFERYTQESLGACVFFANHPDVGTGSSSGSFRSVRVGKERPPCQLASPLPSTLGTTTPAWRTTGEAFRVLPRCGVSYGLQRSARPCPIYNLFAVRTQAAVSITEVLTYLLFKRKLR